MHFTGQVYRHPMEAQTHLLEVTAGCSHNKCAFCSMYRETQFATSPIEHIKEDILELRDSGYKVKRIFLVNGEPFVLSSRRLIEIGEMINKYLPDIETITCYVSIQNLKNKSIEDLKRLKELKYNEFHIGIETAYDPALKLMNKGFTQKDAYEQIEKLHKAGLDYDAHILMGIAGKGNGEIHIKQTLDLINKYPPYMVSVMPLGVTKGSDLEAIRDNGDFVECTELEKLEEEKMLLRGLEFNDAFFFGSHYYNLIPISGPLTQLDQIIERIDQRMEEIGKEALSVAKPRAQI